jgi:hypothetical protein
VVASLALLLAGGGVAYATTLAPRATSLYGCEKNNVVAGKLTTGPQKCPKGYTEIVAAARGQRGPQGVRGPQGHSGVVSSSQTQLVHATDPTNDPNQNGDVIEPGGPTLLPQKIALVSGTWLLTLDFTATPFTMDALPVGQVFPKVTVLANGSPVFTVGGGGLQQLTTDHEGGITSNYSGTYQIKVPSSGMVLRFSADEQVGTTSGPEEIGVYALNGATLSAIKLNA